jgi:nicotinamide-nucleotide amidase
VLRDVEARFGKLGYRRMPESNIGQAMVPEGFTALRNMEGTAPGLWFEEKQKVFVLLPGVPHEMEWLMTKWVLPNLRKKYRRRTSGVIVHKLLQTAGMGESLLAERIGDPKTFLAAGVTLAFLPRIGGVRLRLTAKAANASEARKALSRAERHIRSRIAASIYAEGDTPLEATIVALLAEHRATVSTAESCTAGMLAARITNVAGSSEVFPGGMITYANASKVRDLGVAPALLKKYGAVSEETAVAMAENVRKKFGTTYGVAITGIAGPAGGSKQKPVGTVWIAVAQKGHSARTKLLRNPGNRQMVRERSTEFALEFLRQALSRI